ncbi:hypothetical protein AVEN_53168-1 [Araneus ventricosus]|uniref:Reverse transcriptase domain-containing protein n=1 Tax=Araneus ventricosus TaxID=182803 RepID=A0A4Y2A9L9_ARAVE|nr:hypothetical protein AVEN_53168-1 [Araneus ventricosus]
MAHTRYPPYKTACNKLSEEIKNDIEIWDNNRWKELCKGLNTEDISLYNRQNIRTSLKIELSSRHPAETSNTGVIKAGTPQGSVLSPILYSIFTSDFLHEPSPASSRRLCSPRSRHNNQIIFVLSIFPSVSLEECPIYGGAVHRQTKPIIFRKVVQLLHPNLEL